MCWLPIRTGYPAPGLVCLCALAFLLALLPLSQALPSAKMDELFNDVQCATHAYDASHCQNLVHEKWGKRQDDRSICCFFIDVQACQLRRREEFCRGEFLDAFRAEYKRNLAHWKSTKCKDYFQNADCEEQMEIWSLAVLIMLCLISSMACITLVILYTKK